MSKTPTLSSVSGTTLSGAQIKSFLTGIVAAFRTAGMQETDRATITSDTTLTVQNCGLVLVDCTGGNVALTLPTSGSTTDDAIYNIRRLDSTTNTLTVTPGGSDTVDGSSTALSVGANGFLFLQMPAGGTDWKAFAFAASGSNGDITSLSGLTTALSTAQGGTGSAVGPVLRGYIDGLIMSTAGSSATMTIGAGQATDSTASELLSLASSINKTTSAWAVGSGNGGLDTGTIANSTWYYFYLIRRPDTGVVDVVFSTNSSTPTLPANYTQYRYIGAGLTDGSAQWVKFTQIGGDFYWDTPVVDFSSAGSTTASLLTCSVPRGRKIKAFFNVQGLGGASGAFATYFSDPSNADIIPAGAVSPLGALYFSGAASTVVGSQVSCWTNTSGQVRHREINANTFYVATIGYYDQRGGDQ